eukprot:GILI01010259.1.p1 GENE.GILI01010259.1~~GILI01010259.1.p1  ORF type:complete len:1489 (+),score=303.86 GILI01010259.1:604-4467(+)
MKFINFVLRWENEVLVRMCVRMESFERDFEQAFILSDPEKTGFVSLSEFKSIISSTAPWLSSYQLNRLHVYSEKNERGLLNYRAFLIYLFHWQDAVFVQIGDKLRQNNIRIEAMFAAQDTQGSGGVPVHIFLSIISRLNIKCSRKTLTRLSHMMPVNLDGNLLYGFLIERLYQWEDNCIGAFSDQIRAKNVSLQKVFRNFDTDKDGMLTEEEFISALKSLALKVTDADLRRLWRAANHIQHTLLLYHDFIGMLERWDYEIYEKLGDILVEKCVSTEEAFAIFDVDGDGSIVPDEFYQALESLNLGLTRKEMERLMGAIDVDFDGSVSYTEFLERVEPWLDKMLGTLADALRRQSVGVDEVFRQYDDKNSGFLAMPRITAIIRALNPKASPDHVGRLVRRLKHNSDGLISYQDLLDRMARWEDDTIGKLVIQRYVGGKCIERYFRIFDVESTGCVSREEFKHILGLLHLSNRQITQLLRSIDLNDDGTISYLDFLDRLQRFEEDVFASFLAAVEEKQVSIEQVFLNVEDAGRDGRLPLPELLHIIQSMEVNYPLFRVQRILRLLENGEESISYMDLLNVIEHWEDELFGRLGAAIRVKHGSVVRALCRDNSNKSGCVSPRQFNVSLRELGLGLSSIDLAKLNRSSRRTEDGDISLLSLAERLLVWEESVYEGVSDRVRQQGISLEHLCSVLDPQNSGFVSAADFVQTLQNLSLGLSTQQLNRILRSLGGSPSSPVNFREFAFRMAVWEEEVYAPLSSALREKRLVLQELFVSHDSRKDGLITRAQFRSILKGVVPDMTDLDSERLARVAEIVPDGIVSYTKFLGAFKRWEDLLFARLAEELDRRKESFDGFVLGLAPNADGHILESNFKVAVARLGLDFSEAHFRKIAHELHDSSYMFLEASLLTSKLNAWYEYSLARFALLLRQRGISIKSLPSASHRIEHMDAAALENSAVRLLSSVQSGLSDRQLHSILSKAIQASGGAIKNLATLMDKIKEKVSQWSPKNVFLQNFESYAGGWILRVVASHHPYLSVHNSQVKQANFGNYKVLSHFGASETIIETRTHNSCLALEPVDQVKLVLHAFARRGREMARDRRIRYISLYEDHSSTAEILHPHCEVVTLAVVPPDVLHRVTVAQHHYSEARDCLYCEMVNDVFKLEENHPCSRIVLSTRSFVAFVPFAAASPFEVWILPKKHRANFLDSSTTEIEELATIIRKVLRRMFFGLKDPDYNMVMYNIPLVENRQSLEQVFHWHLAITPKFARLGEKKPFGLTVNYILPEMSAKLLRDMRDF